jgi:H/ACA ribonucleoprotein complex subunit 2
MSDSDAGAAPKAAAGPILVSPIAQPLAAEKLEKKLFRLVKKAKKDKCLRRGVKEVVKFVHKKKEKGICIIAGDISPIDVITHVPILCEDHDVPYIFVRSKFELGTASETKRPTSVVLIAPPAGWKYADKFEEVLTTVKDKAPKFN